MKQISAPKPIQYQSGLVNKQRDFKTDIPSDGAVDPVDTCNRIFTFKLHRKFSFILSNLKI